jgi:MFS family permease
MWAPSWSWILGANVLLGISQGLTWSTTVIMKIDLAGPNNRGLAMGLNEFAGYFAVALSALATGYIAAEVGLRPEPFYLGLGFVAVGLLLSVLAVRETRHHVAHESKLAGPSADHVLTQREVILRMSFTDRDLSSVSQAGMVNNLNDGLAWGSFRCCLRPRTCRSRRSAPSPPSIRRSGAWGSSSPAPGPIAWAASG